MTVQEFINDFKKDKVANTNINDHVVSDYIKKKLEVKEYIPIAEKQNVIYTVVDNAMENVHGFTATHSIEQYVEFVMAMLRTHTNLEIEDAYADYDLLSSSNLLNEIIATFQDDYEACNIFLNMYAGDKLQYNSVPYQMTDFLYNLIDTLSNKFHLGELMKDSSEIIDSFLKSLK